MTALLHPGVYVQEIPSGARTIEGAPTGTAIFVGETERGPIGPTRIIGRNDYERLFGGYMRARDGGLDPTPVLMKYAIEGFFANGGSQAFVLRAMDEWDTPALTATRDSRTSGNPVLIEASSPGVWGNGVRITFAASTDADGSRFRIAVFYTPPEDGVERWVEDWDRLSIDPGDENFVVDVLRRSLYIRWFEATAPAIPALDDNSAGPTEATLAGAAVALDEGTGGGSNLADADFPALFDRLAEVSDAALMVAASDRQLPNLDVSVVDSDAYVSFTNLFVDYVLLRPLQDLFLVGELPSLSDQLDPVSAAVDHARGSGGATQSTASNYNGLYWPHIEIADPVGAGNNATRVIPPGGHIAGLYARTDLRRGVWKAPAGTEATLSGVRRLSFDVLDVHQDNLNPQGINALRRIAGAGLVSWGARTRQPSSEWRYVPVRRTAIFLRHSIYNGIQWAVFEPNGDGLWASLRATVAAFMETQFRNGAFAGTTSREAYFVKCDAETTTEIDRTAGIVNVLVGFAPLRPAEFVVVKLSQKVALEA